MVLFSCSHSAEHAHSRWKVVTYLNRRHQMFAWFSLVWVGLSDVYVRLVSMRVIADLNTWILKNNYVRYFRNKTDRI